MFIKRISLSLIASVAVVFSLAAQSATACECCCISAETCNRRTVANCLAQPGCFCIGSCAMCFFSADEGDVDPQPIVASPADYAGDFEEFGASPADEADDCDEEEIISTE